MTTAPPTDCRHRTWLPCGPTGTTTEKNLADNFRALGLEFTAVTFEKTADVYNAYEEGRCDATTSVREASKANQRQLCPKFKCPHEEHPGSLYPSP